MKEYVIKKISGTPDWKNLPILEINIPYLDTPSDISAHAQIGYDDNALYVHLWTEEEKIRAVEKEILGCPCKDSCLEFFFCPMENDSRYFNIEFNSNACLYLGFGSNVNNLCRLIIADIDTFLLPQIKKTTIGWDITYIIPFTLIRRFFPDFSIYSGKKIRANCYKCADLSEPPHYLSWSEITGEPFTFHKPHCFGSMVFSD